MNAGISERYFRIAHDLKLQRNKRNRLDPAQIARDVEAFLERGGLIQKIPIGETGEHDLREGYRNYSRFTQAERDQHRKR